MRISQAFDHNSENNPQNGHRFETALFNKEILKTLGLHIAYTWLRLCNKYVDSNFNNNMYRSVGTTVGETLFFAVNLEKLNLPFKTILNFEYLHIPKKPTVHKASDSSVVYVVLQLTYVMFCNTV